MRPGEEGLAASEDAVLHGFGHEDGVLRGGDGGVHQYAVEAEFHRQRRVRRCAYACVYDQWNFVDEFAEDAQVGGVLQAEAAADGRAERHDGGGARVDEAAGVDDVVGGIGQDGKSLLDQDARGFQRCLNVRVERGLVADTSILTQSERPTSRPRRAARMASSAVKQPAVLGKRKKHLGSMKSSSDSLVRSRLTRRTATVTISAPEASMAARVCGPSLYFPVPTIRRDLNERPAMTRGSIETVYSCRLQVVSCERKHKAHYKNTKPAPVGRGLCGGDLLRLT